MVNVGGTECACGGTHVKNTADIVGITITRIKKVNYIVFLSTASFDAASFLYTEQKECQNIVSLDTL